MRIVYRSARADVRAQLPLVRARMGPEIQFTHILSDRCFRTGPSGPERQGPETAGPEIQGIVAIRSLAACGAGLLDFS